MVFFFKFYFNFFGSSVRRPEAAAFAGLAQDWHKAQINRKGSYDFHHNSLKFLVGMTRFELATP